MYRKGRDRTCRFCGAQFTCIVGNQVFCCGSCRDRWYRKLPADRYYTRKASELKRCVTCDKEFVTNNSRKVYCSKECQIAHREAAYTPVATHECKCAQCGARFETTHAGKRYCSMECRRAHRLSNRKIQTR